VGARAGKRFYSWAHLNAWLLEWATTVADQRVHGTTHEQPAVRFTREALTPLDGRPPYANAHVRKRVTVREHATELTIWQCYTLVATRARRGRQQVVMMPSYYAGHLRVDQTPLVALPLQYDPR